MDLTFGSKTEMVIHFQLRYTVCHKFWNNEQHLCFSSRFGPIGQGFFRCLKGYREAPSSLPVGSSLTKMPHAGLDHRKGKHCHGTTLTHRCFLIQAQGELLQLKPNRLKFLTLCICVHMCMFVFFQANPHASVYVVLSPFKIADKCQSLCLASLCMRTQWLGLQAVVQD